MNHFLSRRDWLIAASSTALVTAVRCARADAKKRRLPLPGFSLYGMKTLTLSEGLVQCAEIGYRCVELPVLADWPGDSAKFSAVDQKEFRDGLAKNNLRLTALMDNLPILGDEAKHRGNLERLQAAAEISRSMSEKDPPLVETVLGGKPTEWEAVKQQFVDRLGEWARVMQQAEVPLAIKAHIANAIQRPEQLAWVLRQVNNPWLTAAYDFSHFELQKMDCRDTIKVLAEHTRFVHVKDAQGEPGKFQFLLPGEGTIDYAQLFQALNQSGYSGDIVVEVSGQVFSKAGYDPIAAAKKSYAALAPAMKHFGGETP
ncbi:sugar phosphate isomerase/epimerase family protein [Anatilimnocola floriformis]|uniref:sugar phosphate isomerase/epimerase family protein n=1 Tax=Anatilimnocola floriformis TaxID=2948575 RepID=UPI0020C4B3E3|nr:sugar phosphate isomerase/epimerase [Anatilimnocola floriformis]